MKLLLAPRPPVIGDADGFDTSDIFHAKGVGERLASIVGDVEGHAVIVLDGPWGSGKSVFAKQWASLLRQRGHAVVYFDAFEHDHLDDAFFPLFGQLLDASDSGGSRFESARASLIKQATPVVKAMPRIAGDMALRAGVGISLADLRQHVGDVTDAEADDVEVLIKESLKQASAQVECVSGFRKALAAAVSEARDGEQGKAPLVFVIDELDRCRPSYALNVLERIKHLFAVDGICFVLVTHLEELAAMVKQAYGLEDADRYLDKFFQLRFDIWRLLSQGGEPYDRLYLQHLAQRMGLPWDPNESTSIIINYLVRLHERTLRDQERVMLNLALFYKANGGPDGLWNRGDREGSLVLAAGLCVMRNLEPELYRAAAHQRLRYEAATSFLNFEQWIGVREETLGRISKFWKLAVVDGEAHATKDERASWGSSPFVHWRRKLAKTCAEIDQLWQG